MHSPRAIDMPEWLRPLGHVAGVSARGRQIYLASQPGWDDQAQVVDGGLVAQVRQALHNVLALLQRAGAGPQHITRMTWYVADAATWQRQLPLIARAYADLLGAACPPMTTVAVAALLHEGALVEIEVTAVLDDDD